MSESLQLQQTKHELQRARLELKHAGERLEQESLQSNELAERCEVQRSDLAAQNEALLLVEENQKAMQVFALCCGATGNTP